MPIPVIKPPRERVTAGFARFADLPEVTTGLPDMDVDGYRRSFFSILDFEGELEDGQVSPAGDTVRPAVVEPSANFGMAYVKAQPGNGVMMHVHDTNESFVVIEGVWSMDWEGGDGDESVVLRARDFVTFPPFVQRSFRCIEAGAGLDYGLLLAIVAGSSEGRPAAEFSPEAKVALAQLEAEQSALAVS